MKVLALDPGRQATAWAVFAAPRVPRSFGNALAGLLEAREFETQTADKIHVRLVSLGLQLRNVLELSRPELVYVEIASLRRGRHGRTSGGLKGRLGGAGARRELAGRAWGARHTA